MRLLVCRQSRVVLGVASRFRLVCTTLLPFCVSHCTCATFQKHMSTAETKTSTRTSVQILNQSMGIISIGLILISYTLLRRKPVRQVFAFYDTRILLNLPWRIPPSHPWMVGMTSRKESRLPTFLQTGAVSHASRQVGSVLLTANT